MNVKYLFLFLVLFIAQFAFVPLMASAQLGVAPLSEEQTIKLLWAEVQKLQKQLEEIIAKQGFNQVYKKEIESKRLLEKGMEGNDVRDLQSALAGMPDVYPEGLVTGFFGSLTEKAVNKFKTVYIGTIPDGKVDVITDETIKAMKAAKIKEMTGGAFATPFYGMPGGFDFPTPGSGSGQKVTICHIPPGDPSNAKTISIGEQAVSAHLVKGSYLGECK